MNTNRREFLKGVAMSAGAGIAAGCVCPKTTGVGGGRAPMRNFRLPPMKNGIRVGIVGVGARGNAAAGRLMQVPGITVTALCDIRPECVEKTLADVVAKTGRKPLAFSGSDTVYKRLCDSPEVDVVYNCTSWNAHAPVSVYAMKAGKHTFIEVPAAMYLDECWELVETAEATGRHCMQLENCCYGEYELLALNLCKLGMLGELIHGEGAYIHDRRRQIFRDSQWERWRNHWNQLHCGNQYSTHGLGPIALDMGINRGDRFDYLVSVDGVQKGYEAYAAATLEPGNPGLAQRFRMADMNVTTIRTALGRTIMLQHDVSTPRPYSRINLISGTKGVFRSYPKLDIFIEKKYPVKRGASYAFDDAESQRIRNEYKHQLYREVGEIARKVGGHGGMDFLMDLRWAYCLQLGLPLDTDVYDLASWCAVNELSERSARNRSQALDIPDFTRGIWKTPCRSNLMDASVDQSKLDFSHAAAAAGQLSV